MRLASRRHDVAFVCLCFPVRTETKEYSDPEYARVVAERHKLLKKRRAAREELKERDDPEARGAYDVNAQKLARLTLECKKMRKQQDREAMRQLDWATAWRVCRQLAGRGRGARKRRYDQAQAHMSMDTWREAVQKPAQEGGLSAEVVDYDTMRAEHIAEACNDDEVTNEAKEAAAEDCARAASRSRRTAARRSQSRRGRADRASKVHESYIPSAHGGRCGTSTQVQQGGQDASAGIGARLRGGQAQGGSDHRDAGLPVAPALRKDIGGTDSLRHHERLRMLGGADSTTSGGPGR